MRWVRISSLGCHCLSSYEPSRALLRGTGRVEPQGPGECCRGRHLQVTQSTIVSWWLQGRAETCVRRPWWAACGWSRNGWSRARCQKGSCSGLGCTCSPSSATASCAWSPGCSWRRKRRTDNKMWSCIQKYRFKEKRNLNRSPHIYSHSSCSLQYVTVFWMLDDFW